MALIQHSWAGEPHASESIKYVDGKIVARNHVTNPSFERNATTGWIFGSQVNNGSRTSISSRVVAGRYSTILSWNAGATSIQTIAQAEVTAQPGQWVAISGWITSASNINRTYVAGIISERDNTVGDLGRHLAHHYLGDYVDSGTDEMTRFEYVVQVSHSDVNLVRAGFRFSNAPGSSFSGPPTSFGYLDGVQVAVADSEEAALAQVATYFDGDTPDYYDNATPKVYLEHGWATLAPRFYI